MQQADQVPGAAPVVVDLGAVVGSNVGFLSERLDCTIHVQDLFANVEAHARGRARDPDVGPLASHLLQPRESVDGMLCWDLFDYLDVTTSRTLAASLTGLSGPEGYSTGCSGRRPSNSPTTRVSCWRPTTGCGGRRTRRPALGEKSSRPERSTACSAP